MWIRSGQSFRDCPSPAVIGQRFCLTAMRKKSRRVCTPRLSTEDGEPPEVGTNRTSARQQRSIGRDKVNSHAEPGIDGVETRPPSPRIAWECVGNHRHGYEVSIDDISPRRTRQHSGQRAHTPYVVRRHSCARRCRECIVNYIPPAVVAYATAQRLHRGVRRG